MYNTEQLRKKLLYRSCHRGCKETDYLLGDFAAAELSNFSPTELKLYEQIVAADDADLYNWLCGNTIMPAEISGNSVMQKLLQFTKNQRNPKINSL